MRRLGLTEDKSFWNKVEKTSNCWNWIGGKFKSGYGRFYWDKQVWRAHRKSLVLHGIKLIDGLVVDHLCRNRSCVNPSHLEQVTNKENLHRSPIAPAYINSTKNTCPQGHHLDKKNKNQRYCSICIRERQRKKDKIKLKEYSRQYYLKNIDHIKQKSKKNYEIRKSKIFGSSEEK